VLTTSSGISQAFRNLEGESVYKRFFSPKKALTDESSGLPRRSTSKTRSLLWSRSGRGCGDHHWGRRYVTFDAANAQRCAEVAFTVEEDYQGQGIASMLLRHLTGIARQKGVSQFEADVLPGNKRCSASSHGAGSPWSNRSAAHGHIRLSLKKE